MDDIQNLTDTYQILGKIGEGSGGIVYKAYHKRLQKEVVLKQIRSGNASRMMNRQETDILKNLNHTYLPQVFDFFRAGQNVYTVMSYIPGQSFDVLMKQGARFSQDHLIAWAMQLCDALIYLHGQRPPVIHSDIKPANIMLRPDGNICLIDFNISFFLDGSTILGYSHGYTSPEQYAIAMNSRSQRPIQNYRTVDERTDIYSVGATFYYLATGVKRTDFRVPPDQALLEARTSKAFAQVILKAMEINPDQRFASAYELFKAFEGISEKNVHYRRQVVRRRCIWIGLAALMAGFIVLGGFGIHEMKVKRVEKYNKMVSQQIQAREDGDTDLSLEYFRQAEELMPGELEAYYQNAYTLYAKKNYDECISFIDYDILENEKLNLSEKRMADIYYLKADSLFRKEAYAEAVRVYKMMSDIGTDEPLYYRDHAIALAYNGQKEDAEDILNDAIDKGLKEDSVYYARGEISKALGDEVQALEDFDTCLNISKDENLKERSLVLSADIYEAQGNREQERLVLLKAMDELEGTHRMIPLERLIQVNINLADETGRTSFRDEAIDELLAVIDQGWDTYQTYNNLAILYQKQEKLDQTKEVLDTMRQKFGEDYNIYKRYAFLEIDRQEQVVNRARDYSAFKNYYDQAEKLYQNVDVKDDAEMQLLENVYAQVKAGGWIE